MLDRRDQLCKLTWIKCTTAVRIGSLCHYSHYYSITRGCAFRLRLLTASLRATADCLIRNCMMEADPVIWSSPCFSGLKHSVWLLSLLCVVTYYVASQACSIQAQSHLHQNIACSRKKISLNSNQGCILNRWTNNDLALLYFRFIPLYPFGRKIDYPNLLCYPKNPNGSHYSGQIWRSPSFRTQCIGMIAYSWQMHNLLAI